MLHAAWRIDHNEVVFVRSSNFPELGYELPQVGAMAQGAAVDKVLFVRSRIFFELRYELFQVARCAVSVSFLDRVVVRQFQFPLVVPIPISPISKIPR